MKLHHSITDLLPKHVELQFVDYRDSLEGMEDEIQEAVQKQDLSPIEEKVWEAGVDQEFESI